MKTENGPKIQIPEYLLNEKIKRAFTLGGLKIEDLFLVIPVSAEHGEGDSFLETKFGKLRVFFCNMLHQMQAHEYARSLGMTEPKVLLLSHKKYPYPKISTPSSRAFKDLPGGQSEIKNIIIP